MQGRITGTGLKSNRKKFTHLRGEQLIQTITTQTQRTFTRRIGSTTYRVTAHFSATSRETLEAKVLRMMKNEIATERVGKLEKSVENSAA